MFDGNSVSKDRKHILKVLKPHIDRMCLDDEAQMVLFTALDVIECVFSLTFHSYQKKTPTNVQLATRNFSPRPLSPPSSHHQRNSIPLHKADAVSYILLSPALDVTSPLLKFSACRRRTISVHRRVRRMQKLEKRKLEKQLVRIL